MGETVVIVDDHAEFRDLAGQLLSSGGFVVVGEAGSGADGIVAVQRLQPDVVLLDVQLPDTDGFAVSEALTRGGSRSRIVLCSVLDLSDYPRKTDLCGAVGFLSKCELTASGLRRAAAAPQG